MNDPVKFLLDIWGKQCKQGDNVFLATKSSSGTWRDHTFTYGKPLHNLLKVWFEDYPAKKYDIYWCPLPFSTKTRAKDGVKYTNFLWQDLDYANPNYFDDNIKPTVTWESSPGRYHGLWELDKQYKPDEVEMINRDLSRHVGADKGGWDLTQVLRIPGTRNHKYKEKPLVKLTWNNPATYKLNVIRDILQTSPVQPDIKIDENALKELNTNALLKKHHKKIPRKALTLLLAKHATMGKRSDIIWYLTNKLNEIGLNPHEVYSLIKGSVWNKYAGRHDEEERLKVEIEKVIEGKFTDEGVQLTGGNTKSHGQDGEGDNESSERGSDAEAFGLRIDSYRDVMENMSSYPGWLVEGFWARRSHGIVAGEPKSLKSTYVIDLAASVASGEPFLGKYPVLEQGPVLYIQNENADWIIRDKMEKIIANRGLGGEAKVKGTKMTVRFPKDLPLYFINQQGYQINDPIHQQIMEKAIIEYKPVLIVFDPLYLMFDGDVNSAKELNPALTWLLHLKNTYKTGVILIHHYNKGGGGNNSGRGGQRMLGSTTLHGWIESAWYMSHPPKEDDGEPDETDDMDEDFDKTSGEPMPIIMDREFRAAGGFPKLELMLTMGETGNPLYEIEVGKYRAPEKKEKGSGRGKTEVSEEDIESDILNILEMNNKPVSQRKLSDDTSGSRRVVKKILDRLAEQGKVNLVKEGAVLIS